MFNNDIVYENLTNFTVENATSKFATKYNLIKNDYKGKPLTEECKKIICRDIAKWLGFMTESIYDVCLVNNGVYLCKANTRTDEEFRVPGHELFTNFNEDGSISASPEFCTNVYITKTLLESGLTGEQVLSIIASEVAKAMSEYREDTVIKPHQEHYFINRYCYFTREEMDGYDYAAHLGLGDALSEACDYCMGKNISLKNDHQLMYVKYYLRDLKK